MNSVTPDAPEQTTPPQEESAPDRTEARIFRFSEFVHVGEGSAECEHGEDGGCSDPKHFHVWLRLPNKFQVVQMQEKAQAARARVLRQAKDPESDRFAIIENQIAEAVDQGPQSMIAELLGRDEFKLQHRAMRELVEEEDSPWATVEEDQVRFNHLRELPEEERDEDEYQELVRHLGKWNEAIDAKYEELVAPERDALEGRTTEELADLLRDIAIREQADQIFMRVFTKWQMVVCTLKPRAKGNPVERVFDNASELEATAPEIIAALEVVFKDLELELNERQQLRAEGN